MIHTRIFGVFAIVVAAIGACDDTEPLPYAPQYDPTNVTPVPEVELCPILAMNVCASLRPCCAPSPFAYDEAKCHAVVRAQCEALKSRAHDAALIYDDVLAGRCSAGVGALITPTCESAEVTLDARSASVALACNSMWHGSAQLGRFCSKTGDCVQIDGKIVVCAAPGGVCTVVKLLQAGDSCRNLDDHTRCAIGLACSAASSAGPLCTAAQLPDGAPCVLDTDCLSDRRCTCPPDVTVSCARRVCQALPGLGETCWTGLDGKGKCARGTRCDSDKSQCVAAKGLGATCGAADECVSKNCRGVCIPGGIVDPLTCSGVFLPGSPFAFLSAPVSTSGPTL